MTTEPALMALDAGQQRAVASPARTLRVLAGAGSGKTRVLTERIARRIADESADPHHTLVLTFTRKAADELRERLGRLLGEAIPPVTTGTFHAVAYAQLRRRWLDQGRTIPTVISQPARVVSDILESLRLNRIANPRAIIAELSWAKSHQLKPDNYVEGLGRLDHSAPVSPAQMQRIFSAYEAEKKKRRTIDYDDLLLLMTSALRADRSFATTQQWMFRHFFVDEFQDLNKAQFELLRAWMGGRDDLFVVGDANQAIYGWNGADSSFLQNLDHYFPQVETITLQTNYRSSKSVLAAAHSLIGGEAVTPEMVDVGAPMRVREFDDDIAEAEGLARAVRDARNRNHRWADMAVLVRTNAQRGVFESAFEKFSIPFHSAGGAAWLYEAEVRGALAYLREARAVRLVERVFDVDEMIKEAGEAEGGYLHQLRAAMQSCLVGDPTVNVGDFLAWVEIGSKQDGPAATQSAKGAVTVTTFHRAKGLEWPVVFLAGIEDGLVPISNADLDEELRLFYVAITRARSELHLSWAHRRSAGSNAQNRRPSPWLAQVQRDSAPRHENNSQDVHAVLDASRAILEAKESGLHAEHESQPVRDAFERWRASRAKMTGIDANLILDDHVIDSIIDLRPGSRDELADIDGLGPVRAANIGDQLLKLLECVQGGNVG